MSFMWLSGSSQGQGHLGVKLISITKRAMVLRLKDNLALQNYKMGHEICLR